MEQADRFLTRVQIDDPSNTIGCELNVLMVAEGVSASTYISFGRGITISNVRRARLGGIQIVTKLRCGENESHNTVVPMCFQHIHVSSVDWMSVHVSVDDDMGYDSQCWPIGFLYLPNLKLT